MQLASRAVPRTGGDPRKKDIGVKVLKLCKDSTLFHSGASVSGDTRERHIRYAEVLREMCGSDSDIRAVTYTRASSNDRYDKAAPGLTATILKLLDDPQLGARLGQAGFDVVSSRFSLDALLRRLVAHWRAP